MRRQWAIEPQALAEIAGRIALELPMLKADEMRAAKDGETPPRGTFENRDGVAHIPIKGVMLKEVPCVMRMFDIDAVSCVDTKAAIEAAIDDETVQSISLDIDSPGGSLDGVQELADTVHAARGLKPIRAVVSDRAASAAYWVASQADVIEANGTAALGGIGVFAVMRDASGLYANMGVRVHVIRSADLKGAGVEGDAVTPEQLGDAQRLVDQAASMFQSAVARGRGLDAATVVKLATGQVWFAGEARDMKLIDEISQVRKHKEQTMAADPKQSQAEQRAEQAEARANAAQAQLNAINAQRREELLTKYADHIAPAAIADMRKYGASLGDDLQTFEKFLAGMPKVTRPERVSDASPAPAKEKPAHTDAQAQSAKILGSNPASLAFYRTVQSRMPDGSALMHDGRHLTREQLEEERKQAVAA